MGPETHLRLTKAWAEEAGLGSLAEEVARADDEFDAIHPGRASLWDSSKHLGLTAALWSWVFFRRALRERSARYLGWALHCIQDFHSHGYLGEKHLLHTLGLLRRDPDEWAPAPARMKRRIESASLSLMRRYRDARVEAPDRACG